MRIAATSRLAMLTFTLLAGPVAFAQFEPAGDPNQADSEAEAAVGSRDDELIRQLESNASRGGRYRDTAIASLARLGAWQAVDRWLAELNDVDDANALTRAAETIGSQLLLRISLRDDLSDASESALQKLFDATRSTKQAAPRLKRAIDQLAGTDVDQNLAATRVLSRGGNAAIEAIVDAIVAGVDGRQRGKLLAILESLGDGGLQSLQQLSLYGKPEARVAALDALAVLAPQAAIDNLLSARFAADATREEVEVAAARLGLGESFQRADAIAVLAQRLDTLRRVAAEVPNDQQPMSLWSIDADQTGVDAVRSSEIFLHYRRSYDAAQRLRRLGAVPAVLLQEVLTADLAYRVMVDVDWGTPQQVEQLKSDYNGSLDVELIVDGLDRTRERRDIPATIGLLRLVREMAKAESQPERFLRPRGNDVAALVAAATDANVRVRFEAATIITELLDASQHPASFPAASHYRKTLAEMALLTDSPTAVLVETRPVVALRQETILGQLGYQVRTATNGLQAERLISQGGDVRLLVSKVQLADITAPELVDRVRRLNKGRGIPIIFYHDEDTHPKSVKTAELETTSTRWADGETPAVHLVPLPGAPAALFDPLAEIVAKHRLPPLSISERQNFRSIGQAALEGGPAHR